MWHERWACPVRPCTTTSPAPAVFSRRRPPRSGMRFVQRLTEHLSHLSDPVDALVECLAYSLEWLPGDKHVQLMLVHDFTKASTGVTSEMGFKFGHALLAGLDVDWAQFGREANDLDDLVEYLLRILQSFMIDPGRPPRTGDVLRAYLRRWVAPVLTAETSDRPLGDLGELSSRAR